ncbi:MAG: CoA transferase, partial [Dehalococcoidia bacterium]
PELIYDPKFSNPRMLGDEDKAALADLIASWFRVHSADEALELCQTWRVPSAKVMSARDLVEDPHLAQRGFFSTLDHPSTGPVVYPGPAFRNPGSPDHPTRAPLLGEHNRELYHQRLGYSLHEMERLGAMGVI